MPKLKINLKYVVKGDDGKPVSNQQITQNYLMIAVHSKYPNGLDGTYRRIFGRIMSKMDDAIENLAEEVELENSEIDLIKNAVKDSRFPAPMAFNANVLEDAIDQIK